MLPWGNLPLGNNIRSGEEWFMEACLLYPYEINDIKKQL